MLAQVDVVGVTFFFVGIFFITSNNKIYSRSATRNTTWPGQLQPQPPVQPDHARPPLPIHEAITPLGKASRAPFRPSLEEGGSRRRRSFEGGGCLRRRRLQRCDDDDDDDGGGGIEEDDNDCKVAVNARAPSTSDKAASRRATKVVVMVDAEFNRSM